MQHLFVLSLLVMGVNHHATSQAYFTAMGIRMGTEFGITLQQRILGGVTGQGIVSANAVNEKTTATVLVQLHNPLITRNVNFYIGGGLHQRWKRGEEPGSGLSGVTGVAGAELTLGKINISWDYKPVYHLNATDHAFESETAVSLRYIFIKKLRGKKKRNPFWKKDEKTKKKLQRKRRLRKRQREKDKHNGRKSRI